MSQDRLWTTSTTTSRHKSTNYLITERERDDLKTEGCCLCGTSGFLYLCPDCSSEGLLVATENLADDRAWRDERILTEGHEEP